MDGGTYLNQGADTCLVRPHVKCDGFDISGNYVSRLVNAEAFKEGQENAIHDEILTNPVYARFRQDGATPALASIKVKTCPANNLTIEDVSGAPVKAGGPCGSIKMDFDQKRDMTNELTNIITPYADYKSLAHAVDNRIVLVDDTYIRKFSNVFAFLEESTLHRKRIVHTDLHYKNMFYDATNQLVYMHDFGRGVLYDKEVYDPEVLLNNEVYGIRDLYRPFNDMKNPMRYLQASVPFLMLWWTLNFFEGAYSTTTKSHNQVVEDYRSQLTTVPGGFFGFGKRNSSIRYVYGTLWPKVNFDQPYFHALVDCLKCTDDNHTFLNLFNLNSKITKLKFPKFVRFINGCLKYADLFALCNALYEDFTNEGYDGYPNTRRKQVIQLVFETLYSTPSADALSVKSLIEILTSADLGTAAALATRTKTLVGIAVAGYDVVERAMGPPRRYIGGAYLANGADTCVVHPNVACPGNPPSDDNVSRIVNTNAFNEGQEDAIHTEILTNPVYAPFIQGGETPALESIKITSCPASELTYDDLVGTPPPTARDLRNPCRDIQNNLYFNEGVITNKTNVITPYVPHDTLAAAITAGSVRVDKDYIGKFSNIFKFFDTTTTQQNRIVHTDLHYKNMFYDAEGKLIYIHDFGRGVMYDRDVYNPDILLKNEVYRMRTFYSPFNVVRVNQASIPFLVLWWTVNYFEGVQNPKSFKHNKVVEEYRAKLTGPIKIWNKKRASITRSVYGPSLPDVNFDQPYFHALVDCLRSTNDNQPFVNLFKFNSNDTKSEFPGFIHFINGCFKYADLFAVCNKLFIDYNRYSYGVEYIKRIELVFDTLYSTPSADALSVNSLVDILTSADLDTANTAVSRIKTVWADMSATTKTLTPGASIVTPKPYTPDHIKSMFDKALTASQIDAELKRSPSGGLRTRKRKNGYLSRATMKKKI